MPGLISQQAEQPAGDPGDMVEAFIDNAYKLIYSDATLPEVINHLKSNDPVEGIIGAALIIVQRLVESAIEAGKTLDQRTVLGGVKEIVRDLAELSATQDIHQFTPEELAQVVEMAIQQAMELQQQAQPGAGGAQQQAQPGAGGAQQQPVVGV